MTPHLANYSIVLAIFSLLYFLFLLPGFVNSIYAFKFIEKKVVLAILVGFYFSFAPSADTSSNYTLLSFLAVYLYVSFTLAKDCPKGYAESATPLLKAAFTFITFFTSFSLERRYLMGTIVTVILLLSLCIITYLVAQNNSFEPKSQKIELIILCIEHLFALVISTLLTTDSLMRVVIMALTEEIVLVMVHLAIMFIVMFVCKEPVIGYASERRTEMLS